MRTVRAAPRGTGSFGARSGEADAWGTPLSLQATAAPANHYAGDVKIYTRDGDDGTTGLYFGGRASKSSDQIEVNGEVDEAQSTLGWARSLTEPGSRLNEF